MSHAHAQESQLSDGREEFGIRKNFSSLPPLGSTHAVQGRLLDASINGCQDLDVIGTGAIWKGLISQTLKVVAQAIDDWISIQRA